MIGGVCMMMALLAADPYAQAFETANAAYLAEDYAAAARAYEDLVAEDVADPVVFFNLGNAYYKQGLLGLAIANYERALRMAPGMGEARENLETAVRQTPDKLARPAPPAWEHNVLFWHYDLSYRVTWWLAAGSWCVFWLLLALRAWRPFPYLRGALAGAAVLAAAFAWSAWAKAHADPLAVAVEQRVPLRYGPDESVEVIVYVARPGAPGVPAELREGDRVRVERRTAGWARVNTADGRRGWAPENALAFVSPPYRRPPAAMSGEGKETANSPGVLD
jgi:hypothetical protein